MNQSFDLPILLPFRAHRDAEAASGDGQAIGSELEMHDQKERTTLLRCRRNVQLVQSIETAHPQRREALKQLAYDLETLLRIDDQENARHGRIVSLFGEINSNLNQTRNAASVIKTDAA